MNINNLSDKIVHTLKLPYKGDHSTNLISSQFNIKDDANKQHKHDLVYFSRCASTNGTGSYFGETARGLCELVVDHAGRDTKLHIVRHCLNSNHENENHTHIVAKH